MLDLRSLNKSEHYCSWYVYIYVWKNLGTAFSIYVAEHKQPNCLSHQSCITSSALNARLATGAVEVLRMLYTAIWRKRE